MSRMQVHIINESDWLRIAKRADMGRANDTVIYVLWVLSTRATLTPCGLAGLPREMRGVSQANLIAATCVSRSREAACHFPARLVQR